MPSILLVPIGHSPTSLHIPLLKSLGRVFKWLIRIEDAAILDPTPAYDIARNQYLSNRLLLSLLQRYPAYDGKILGITELDLFAPVLTYVFGEAQLDGTAAVISGYRLNDKIYGLPPNQKLLEQRLLKEAVHELGHTFGLIHCQDFDCVMHTSTAVEELDLKNHDFCPVCSIKLRTGEVSTS